MHTHQIITMSLIIILFFLPPFFYLTHSLPVCRDSCANVRIDYPFGIDDGCGSPLYRNMLNCSTTFAFPTTTSTSTSTSTTNTNTTTPTLTPTIGTSTTALFFQTPSGSYKVESIDYSSKTLTLYDPSMSTCTILQPHHDFLMSDIQSALIPPSPDTVFALVNCSIDSPVLNHYKSLCFNFSTHHSCDDLYATCTSFKIFQMLSNDTPPACCFTSYATLKFMSMNILDCTHYTSFYDVDKLKEEEKPLDWSYGIKLSYSLPDTGCDRCQRSGGTCGFDVETEGTLCICSSAFNSSRQCGGTQIAGAGGTQIAGRGGEGLFINLSLSVMFIMFLFLMF
ncbi:hypothetical protein QVD17_26411 [Tagetes erecta]|uniref:Wall-associated receptor kinase C-terminal domain-containing protein n=1 Tax=Tagetes erecta TaxID=13708 RepID=A0AAD8NIJ9_TARER|nr:hypothetical protein QVD17_26411 [Tagetes erecta]